MSRKETLSASLTLLQRVFQKLGYTPETTEQDEESVLSKLSPDIRQYLKETESGKWPADPAASIAPNARETTHLKVYLAWTLQHDQLWKAMAAILLLENSHDDVMEASLFDDVMQHIEEKVPGDVIPPQLLVTWAKHLQVKGDLHGAIRRLNAARTLIADHKSSFPCPCEVDRVRGECTQLAGLTLNKMCCWKNAVEPLMESVDIFRACAAEDRNLEAIVVSLEMAAKCLCNLPHGDYLELKEELGFQHGDRFYQAYTMCKDAASLASSSQLLLVRAQNQAAESLLKFAAQHEDDATRYQYLEQVVAEVQKSLQAHTSAFHLSRREQFFEFVHSLFLVSLALNFSDSSKDCAFADTLGEQARFLYAEYCRQLSEHDFQPAHIELRDCPQAEGVIHSVAEMFNLSLDLLKSTVKAGKDEGRKVGKGEDVAIEKLDTNGCEVVNGHGTGLLDKKVQGLNFNADGSRTSETNGEEDIMVQPNSSGRRSTKREDVNDEAEKIPTENQQNGHSGKFLLHDVITAESLVKESEQAEREQRSSLNTQAKEAGRSSPLENVAQNDEEQLPPPPPRRQQEVGLPVDPEDYSIPVYDVPLSIFQDLIGCKFSGVTATTTTNDNPSNPLTAENPALEKQDAPKEDEQRDGTNEEASMRGITVDSGFGSSVGLVDTCLTTKLLTHSEMDSLGSSAADSGMESDFSASAGKSGDSRNSSSYFDSAISSPSKPSGSSLSLGGSEVHDTVRKARLLKFNPVTGIWSSQMTLVYVGQPLQLDPKVKGNCRDALHVQFLHQDEVLGRYVGKRYRRQRPPSQYLQDVTCQKTARFLVTLFNYALKDLRYDIQVVYVPVAHVQLLSRDGEEVEDWLNVEPYLEGDFIKLTNNLHFCNSQGKTLSTALTHFTHSVSDGKLMLVDLQGWLPREGRGVVYLTDPQFHTNTPTSLSSCDMGPKGMRAFWESVHPQCNAICHALGLKRPTDQEGA
ncbi:uncharacterized protein [Littorina saxatilis]|uniref:Alpha-type protein kinase domain-containing protein n=1 Tax=Littorina saxatilis TaxID=31220 RepID=A0AAN9BZZ2_9CAEN